MRGNKFVNFEVIASQYLLLIHCAGSIKKGQQIHFKDGKSVPRMFTMCFRGADSSHRLQAGCSMDFGSIPWQALLFCRSWRHKSPSHRALSCTTLQTLLHVLNAARKIMESVTICDHRPTQKCRRHSGIVA